MKKLLLSLMLLFAATVTVCAQDVPVQTEVPVVNCTVDVFNATIEINHDDPEAVIYWRYNYYDWPDWTAWTDWKVYTEPVELQFKDNLYIIEYQVECYAVSPGKTASEVVEYSFSDTYAEFGFPQVTPPLVYANRVDNKQGLAVRIVDGLFGDSNKYPLYGDNSFLLYVAGGRYIKPEHYYYKINDSNEWIEYDGEIYLDQYGEYKIMAKTTNGNLEREVTATVVYDSTGFISQSDRTIVCDGLVYYTDEDNTASVPDYYVNYLWSMTYPIIAPLRSGNIVIPGVIHINNHDYTVKSIGCNAFDHFSGVSIPSTVTLIHVNDYDCHEGYPLLTSLSVEEGNPVYDSRNNCNAVIETASNQLILGCLNTVIPETVTEIGTKAFYFCNNLASISIPASVTTIKDDAFYCGGLRNVVCHSVTPPSVESYSFYVFACFDERTTTLFVPTESLAAYQAHDKWSKFSRIVPFLGAGPGDINGDGKIAISDVTNLINQLLASGEMPAFCDVNGDGKVSIADVSTLIELLLNGN